MNSAVVGLCALSILFLAYRYYGSFLSSRIFKLHEEKLPPPAHELRDGVDYVPTKKEILIGHHYSSIAGAAPIVGPAVAAIWGWVPAILWIVVGVVFMGACHDFGALVLSMKHKGGSIAQVAQKVLGRRVRNLFLLVIFFLIFPICRLVKLTQLNS